MDVTPIWSMGGWRIRDDDGTLSTATFLAIENGTLNLIADKKYRIRAAWGESAAASPAAASGTVGLQYRVGAVAYATMTTSTSQVRITTSTHFTDGDTETTQRLTIAPQVLTWANVCEADENGTVSSRTLSDQGVESEFCFQVVGADVSENDQLNMRVYRVGSGAAFGNGFTDYGTFIIVKPWIQGHYRYRNDDQDLVSATWKAAQDTAITQAVDTNFRLRMNFGNRNASSTGGSPGLVRLQYSLNGGSYTTVDTTTAVKYAASTHVSDNTSVAMGFLTAPTGATSILDSGFGVFDSASGYTASSFAANKYQEIEFCLQIDSAQVAHNDTITFQLTWDDNIFHFIDTTPSLTVSEITTPPAWKWTPTQYNTLLRM